MSRGRCGGPWLHVCYMFEVIDICGTLATPRRTSMVRPRKGEMRYHASEMLEEKEPDDNRSWEMVF